MGENPKFRNIKLGFQDIFSFYRLSLVTQPTVWRFKWTATVYNTDNKYLP